MKKTALLKRIISLLMVCVTLCCISVPVFAVEINYETNDAELTVESSFYLDVYDDTRGVARGKTYIPAGWHYIYFSATTPGLLEFNCNNSGYVPVEVSNSAGEAYRLFENDAVEWIFTPYKTYVDYSYSFIVD